jgi:hypothetical protein
MGTTKSIRYGISAPEVAYNDLYPLASGYTSILANEDTPVLPNQDKEDDTGVRGRGQEFPTRMFGGYWQRQRFVYTEKLNTGHALLHTRRALGGVDAVTSLNVSARQHLIYQLLSDQTPQLPSCNLVSKLLGADFLHAGCCVESLTIQQNGSAIPTYSVTYISSGKHRRLREITTANGYTADFGTLPDVVDQDYVRGANVLVQWNDGSLYDLTASGRARNLGITIANNHIVDDTRIGDPSNMQDAPAGHLTAAGYTEHEESGWVQNHLEYGDRTVTCETVMLLEQNTLREWDAMRRDLSITGFIYRATGKRIPGSTDRHTYEIQLPATSIRSTTGGSDGGRAIVTVGFFVKQDSVSKGQAIARGINASTSVIL